MWTAIAILSSVAAGIVALVMAASSAKTSENLSAPKANGWVPAADANPAPLSKEVLGTFATPGVMSPPFRIERSNPKYGAPDRAIVAGTVKSVQVDAVSGNRIWQIVYALDVYSGPEPMPEKGVVFVVRDQDLMKAS